MLDGEAIMTMELSPARREQRADAAGYRLVIDDIERYRVVVGDETVGYIDVVGAVFVALSGSTYPRAVEVRQSLVLEDAAAAVLTGR